MPTETREPRQAENVDLRAKAEECRGVFVISRVLHLGVMVTDEVEICEDLTDFVANDLDERLIDQLKPGLDLDRLKAYLDDEEMFLAEFVCACADQHKYGFLCRVEAPEVRLTKEPGVKGIHYGIRTVRWFYDETLEGILKQADAWALSMEKPA